jgi:hypothetical protein
MKKHIKEGISWGVWMFVFMALLFPLIKGEEITFLRILFAIPFWALSGFFISFVIRKFNFRKEKKN